MSTTDHKRWQKLNLETHRRFRQSRFRMVTAKGKILGQVDRGVPLSYSIHHTNTPVKDKSH